jgi:hypothetical protein
LNTDSRIYVFEVKGSFKLSWIEAGSFYETIGNWKVDDNRKTLFLAVNDQVYEYNIDLNKGGLVLNPKSKSEKYFVKLHLKRLAR